MEVSQSQTEEENPIALAELPNLSSIWEDGELLSHCIDYDAIVKEEKLAAGACGEVWRAMHRSQEVVVKSLREDVITGSKSPTASSGNDVTAVYHRRRAVLDFVEEIRIMSRLEHNRIVEFRGVALSAERDLLLIMEYLPRGDLRTFLNAVKRKGENATSSSGGSHGSRDQFQSIWTWTKSQWRLAIDIIEGLVYLHSLNPPLVHGDLKSANVLLRSNLRAKLTDFGLSRYLPSTEGEGFGSARSRIEEDAEKSEPPQYGTKARGTGRWMAPELLASGAQSSMASDVYAFGIVLSEIDTCDLPFAEREKLAARSLLATAGEGSSEDGAMNESAVVHKIVSEGWKPTFRVTCPEMIKKLALECLSSDPSARPTSLAVAHRIRKAATKRERPEVLAAQAKVTTSLRIR
ncbi:putative serine/threonine-protein kinase pats1 [Phytophthora citrophthora]|uniref:Serine/threonine-protein kinase pats1 n=1 Tax=Phytophthora citrophthora TaxID=4793 RepID=A0AAD9GIF6_9STRA|nr:putative serine/threonine-protein kinase pats1 [Phytophthora citrophthora]